MRLNSPISPPPSAVRDPRQPDQRQNVGNADQDSECDENGLGDLNGDVFDHAARRWRYSQINGATKIYHASVAVM